MFEQLRVNYEELESVGSRFQGQADNIEQMLDRLQHACGVLRNGAWQGSAAMAFYEELDNVVFPAVRRLHETLVQANFLSADVSRVFHDGETQAKDPFAKMASAGPAVNASLAEQLRSSWAERMIPDDWLANVKKMLGQTPQSAGPTGDQNAGSTQADSGTGGGGSRSGGGSGSQTTATGTAPASSPTRSTGGAGGGAMGSKNGGLSPSIRSYDWPRSNLPNGYTAASRAVSTAGGLPHSSLLSAVSTQPLNSPIEGNNASGAPSSGGSSSVVPAPIQQIGSDISPWKVLMAVASPFSILAAKEVKRRFDGQ